MTARRITCRMLGTTGDRCTAEAIDPLGDILICLHHAAAVMALINERTTTAQPVKKARVAKAKAA